MEIVKKIHHRHDFWGIGQYGKQYEEEHYDGIEFRTNEYLTYFMIEIHDLPDDEEYGRQQVIISISYGDNNDAIVSCTLQEFIDILWRKK